MRDELKILSKLQAFAGNPLCGAVCMNCFEKCTYFFANIKDDLRNAPKRLRITVNRPDKIQWSLTNMNKALKERRIFLNVFIFTQVFVYETN